MNTPETFANLHDLAVEEILIFLWDSGYENISDPATNLADVHLALLNRRFAVRASRIRKVEYWTRALNLTKEEFSELLKELGHQLSPKARTVPKGSIKKLRRKLGSVTPPTVDSSAPSQNTLSKRVKWQIIGSERHVETLSSELLLNIHKVLEQEFLGTSEQIEPPGLKDRAMLDSAASRPSTSLGAKCKYPTVEMAAAALVHSVIQNHPFYNGNKRTGLVALIAFLDLNGQTLTANSLELRKLVLKIASHNLLEAELLPRSDAEVLEIAKWIRSHSRPTKRGERPLTHLEFERILRKYKVSRVQKKDQRVFSRTVEKKKLRKAHFKELRASIPFRADGVEVPKAHIKEVRRRLELDEVHGIDSDTFYDDKQGPAEIVGRYRSILRQLARL